MVGAGVWEHEGYGGALQTSHVDWWGCKSGKGMSGNKKWKKLEGGQITWGLVAIVRILAFTLNE